MKKIYRKIVKKLVPTLLMVCLCLISNATTYYVSNAGNDNNSGLTTTLSWKTLNKVSTSTFQPGDSILLKRGDVWREYILLKNSGNLANRITISNYGTGSKPKILGSAQPASWTDQGGNIWKSDANFTSNPYNKGNVGDGNVWIINNDLSVSTGIYQTSLGALTADNMWYYGSNSIYLYSTSNPAARYNCVEVNTRGYGLGLNHNSYITIDGIDIFYGGTCIYEGYISQGGSGLIVRNCELAYSGYPDGNSAGILICYNNSIIENNIIHDHGRRGISLTNIASSLTMRNITIRNNYFYHGYHTTSVDLQLTGGSYTGSMDSVFIYGNTIADDVDRVSPFYPMQMFISDQSSPGTITHIYVYNNVFKGTTGAAINIGGAEDVKVWNNTFYSFNAITTADRQFLFIGASTVDVKNNIFYSQLAPNSDFKGIIMLTSGGKVTSDYNVIYRTSKTSKIYHAIGYGDYTSADSTLIRSVLSWDIHSKYRDPLVVSSSDLSLQSGSPCIKAGLDVGLPFTGIAPDIGAYQTSINTDVPISVSNTGSQNFEVYPNPSQGEFTVHFAISPVTGSRIDIFDIAGRKVFSRMITKSYEELNLSGVVAGLYLVKLIVGSEEKIQKLIIQY
jgi:hypothetical protein